MTCANIWINFDTYKFKGWSKRKTMFEIQPKFLRVNNGHDGLMYNAFLTLALPKISQDCIIPCLFSCIHFSFLSNTGQWSPVCQRTIVLRKDNNDKKLFVSVEHFNCFWLYIESMVLSDINFATLSRSASGNVVFFDGNLRKTNQVFFFKKKGLNLKYL